MKKTAIKEIIVNAKKLNETKTEDELFEIIGYEMKIKELEAENAKLQEENKKLRNKIIRMKHGIELVRLK